jgi:hypothetical protein
MAVPLNTCTTIEQRGVLRFLWAKIAEVKDIHKEMLPIWTAARMGSMSISFVASIFFAHKNARHAVL